MRVLITGASGFVGPHLARELLAGGHQVELSAPMRFELRHQSTTLNAHVCDLLDANSARQLIEITKPEAVIHLAGLSHVHQGTQNRAKMVDLNVTATGTICAALAETKTKSCFLLVSSALLYPASENGETVVNETTAPKPDLPYGLSKLAAEYVAKCFASETLRIYVARPFNHIGPGQTRDFVCPGLAHRIVVAEDGGTIAVGNLRAKRDFTDVRDMVRAYRLLIEKQPKQDTFVLGSGTSVAIQEILERLIQISGKKITTTVDPELLRSIDPPCFRADSGLAKELIGWRPEISLTQSLQDIYNLEQNLALQL